MIQESQNMQNNGGGGNTGYMQRGQKDENQNSEQDMSIFDGALDSFECDDEPEPKEIEKVEKGLFGKLLDIIISLFSKFLPQKPQTTQGDSLTLSGKK
jgi:hypothetical protein